MNNDFVFFPVGIDIQPASSISYGTSKTANTGRPELKRYRQYTRHDIAAAIEAVRSGQSALQASRLYGVPSRTLYDKVRCESVERPRTLRAHQCGVFFSIAAFSGEKTRYRDRTTLSPVDCPRGESCPSARCQLADDGRRLAGLAQRKRRTGRRRLDGRASQPVAPPLAPAARSRRSRRRRRPLPAPRQQPRGVVALLFTCRRRRRRGRCRRTGARAKSSRLRRSGRGRRRKCRKRRTDPRRGAH